MTIYDRIDKAFAEIAQAAFKKDRWVGKWINTRDENGKVVRNPDLTHDGYWVISIANILASVQKAHANNGVKCIFEGPFYDVELNERRVTLPYREGKRVVASAHYDVRIIGEGPDDMIELRVQCEAWDTEANDKLNNKLLTNAMRSLYRSLYAIDADDSQDPEEEDNTVSQSSVPAEPPVDDPLFGSGPKRSEMKALAIEWIKANPDNPELKEFMEASGSDWQNWATGTYIHLYKDIISKEVSE